MDICHSPESGTPGAPLRPKSSTPRSGFVQPAPCSQQPPVLLFSTVWGDLLLLGFAGAWPPAAVAEGERSAETFHRFLRIGLNKVYDHD